MATDNARYHRIREFAASLAVVCLHGFHDGFWLASNWLLSDHRHFVCTALSSPLMSFKIRSIGNAVLYKKGLHRRWTLCSRSLPIHSESVLRFSSRLGRLYYVTRYLGFVLLFCAIVDCNSVNVVGGVINMCSMQYCLCSPVSSLLC